MRLQQFKNGQYIITVPKDIAIALNWKKFDTLKFRLYSIGRITILGLFKPAKKDDQELNIYKNIKKE